MFFYKNITQIEKESCRITILKYYCPINVFNPFKIRYLSKYKPQFLLRQI